MDLAPWVLQLQRALTDRTAVPLDASLCPAQLHPYQRAAVEFGLSVGGKVLLGHEMGLGIYVYINRCIM